MDILDLIENRRSIRRYENKVISDQDLKELIKGAISAPSAGNIQPWEFIIIREREVKEKLVEAALGQEFIMQAAVVIVVCANPVISARYYGTRGANLYCIQDTAAAIENLLILAKSKGIGSCWIGAFSEDLVSKVLSIPPSLRPVALILLGYPAESPRKPSRRSIEDVIHYEKF